MKNLFFLIPILLLASVRAFAGCGDPMDGDKARRLALQAVMTSTTRHRIRLYTAAQLADRLQKAAWQVQNSRTERARAAADQALYEMSHPRWLAYQVGSDVAIAFFFDADHYSAKYELMAKYGGINALSGGGLRVELQNQNGNFKPVRFYDVDNLATINNAMPSDEMNEKILAKLLRELAIAYPRSVGAPVTLYPSANLPSSYRSGTMTVPEIN